MIDRFINLLGEATARIQAQYFHLPVAGLEDAIYRERVYTYELYHQLRLLLDAEDRFREYALGGEVDKSGHPVIRRCAPDFVLHIPGRMTNLAVVEVKPINADAEGLRKDKQTLEYFVSNEVRYQLGIELVYGDGEANLARFAQLYADAPERIQLFWHRRPGAPAVRV